MTVLFVAVLFDWVDGLSCPGPIEHLLLVAATLWLSTLALLALAHQAAPLPAAGLGLVLVLVETVTAETTGWWWQPWAWIVRTTPPLTGPRTGIRAVCVSS